MALCHENVIYLHLKIHFLLYLSVAFQVNVSCFRSIVFALALKLYVDTAFAPLVGPAVKRLAMPLKLVSTVVVISNLT